MRTRIVRIGNSRGIRIPKLLLEETGLDGDVEIEARPGRLVVSARRPDRLRSEVAEPVAAYGAAPEAPWEPREGTLADLLARAARGEEVVLELAGRPVAKLVPLSAEPRRPGRLKGRIVIAPDFDAPLPPAIAAAFRGEGG